MPSSVCKTDLSITSERPAWSKFLPKRVNEKRQQNYEKRVLKKIQEDALEQLPKCDDFPSFKVCILWLPCHTKLSTVQYFNSQ